MLDLIAKLNDNVKTKMTKQHNVTYTGHSIQNEILAGLADMVCTSILREIKESEYYGITVDDTKDMSKKEQMSGVMKYYYRGAVHEIFLHFGQLSI